MNGEITGSVQCVCSCVCGVFCPWTVGAKQEDFCFCLDGKCWKTEWGVSIICGLGKQGRGRKTEGDLSWHGLIFLSLWCYFGLFHGEGLPNISVCVNGCSCLVLSTSYTDADTVSLINFCLCEMHKRASQSAVMHQMWGTGATQCVSKASYLLSYVSTSADRCAGPCCLPLERFRTSYFWVPAHWCDCVCVCVWISFAEVKTVHLIFLCSCAAWDCCASQGERKRQTAATRRRRRVLPQWPGTERESEREYVCVCVFLRLRRTDR